MGLIQHAEEEMRRAGLFDKDSDYGGMVAEAVMKMVKCLADEGHSGMSHDLTMEVFNRVANFKTLTPLTNDPAEWHDVTSYGNPDVPMWQSLRDPSMFSNDGGKTYYNVGDPMRALNTSKEK